MYDMNDIKHSRGKGCALIYSEKCLESLKSKFKI